jgi:hypothetical protein
MKTAKLSLSLASVLMVLGLFSGCEGGGGGGDVDVHGSVYMGVGIYDPWYYGPGYGPGYGHGGYYPPAAIVCPPRPMPPRPGGGGGMRPTPRMR